MCPHLTELSDLESDQLELEPLRDEEEWERELADGEIWKPEPEPEEDPLELERLRKDLPDLRKHIKPSQFTSFAFRMPNPETLRYSSTTCSSHLRSPNREVYSVRKQDPMLLLFGTILQSSLRISVGYSDKDLFKR